MTVPYYGYPAQVWECCFNSIQWLSGVIDTTNPIQSASAVETVYETLRNGVYAVQAWSMLNAWQGELILLQEVEALPLGLNTANETFFTNRIAAVEAAIADFPNYTPAVYPSLTVSLLQQGKIAVPYTGIIEGLMQARYEATPAGLVYNNVRGKAVAESIAWQAVVNAVRFLQGNNLTQAYDAASRMLAVATAAPLVITNLSSGVYNPNSVPGASDPATMWNQTIAIPTLTALASLIYSPPSTTINQECGAIRYALGTITDSLALLILALRKPAYNTVNLGDVRAGDSLMDVAARNLGNFEQWSAIATLNGLQQPWTGTSSAPTVAEYGSSVLLPPAAGSTVATGYPTPSYSVNVLGADLYLGPLNQPMLPWAGDFETISGYKNLSLSLGRRLQTPIGDLVYHTDFGSRIPPEVGAVQDNYDLQRICVYAESALLSDGRVSAVVSATATAPQGSNASVQFTGTVQPVGYGALSVEINETLAPAPTGIAGG